jgi:hypothetical protein
MKIIQKPGIHEGVLAAWFQNKSFNFAPLREENHHAFTAEQRWRESKPFISWFSGFSLKRASGLYSEARETLGMDKIPARL